MAFEDRVAAEIRVTLERRPEGLVGLKCLAHRMVHLAREDLHQNGIPIQPLRLIGCPARGGGHGDAETTSVGERLAQLRPLVDEHLDQVLLVEIGIAGQVGDIAHVCDQRDDAGNHVRMPAGTLLCRQALRRVQEIADRAAQGRPFLRGVQRPIQPSVDFVYLLDIVLDVRACAVERRLGRGITAERQGCQAAM